MHPNHIVIVDAVQIQDTLFFSFGPKSQQLWDKMPKIMDLCVDLETR